MLRRLFSSLGHPPALCFGIGPRQALLLLDRRGSQRSLLSVRRTWLALALMLAACGGPSREQRASSYVDSGYGASNVSEDGLTLAVCPRRVPLLRGWTSGPSRRAPRIGRGVGPGPRANGAGAPDGASWGTDRSRPSSA